MAQTNTPAPLPPAAQEAFNKGIIAAKVPDYLLAIRYFEEARKLAPEAPVIYLNMGLAESKIPGRELRAMAWFGVYLAAHPDAPNAAVVKEQIAVLEVKSQSTLSRLIKQVQDSASQVSGDSREDALTEVPVLWAKAGDIAMALKAIDLLESDIYKGSALGQIAEVQAGLGDFDEAQKTADLIQNEGYKCEALTAIAQAQITSGDRSGAEKTFSATLNTAGLIENDDRSKSEALCKITLVQARAGNITGAQTTADLISDKFYKIPAQAGIAKAQAASGDTAGAKATLDSALTTVELTKDANDKSAGLAAIAETQITIGDIVGARKNLSVALKTVDLIEGVVAELLKSRARSDIAQAQARSGDIAGAQKTANLISINFPRLLNPALAVIAEAQAKAGDMTGAKKTANRIKDVFDKGYAQQLIADAQAKASETKITCSSPQVSAWLTKLDDNNPANDCPLNTAPFLDLTGHLKSLPPSDKDWEVFDQIKQTARSMAWAQNSIGQLLKQQAKP